jgi:hypothetical protein
MESPFDVMTPVEDLPGEYNRAVMIEKAFPTGLRVHTQETL